LSVKEWDDVADLCEQGAAGCEVGYEEHELKARDRAARWMRALAMKAHVKARNLEEQMVPDSSGHLAFPRTFAGM